MGHEVVEITPRYPDPAPAFIPQYVGGVRAELELLEHPSRVESRTKQLLLLGRALGPRALGWGERHGERIAATVDERVFGRCDVLLTPTLTHRPPLIGQLEGASVLTAALRSMPAIAYTAIWNVTGHPAASVPAGFADDGLPVAVQLVGRRGDEPTLLALSAQLESVRPWADHRPTL